MVPFFYDIPQREREKYRELSHESFQNLWYYLGQKYMDKIRYVKVFQKILQNTISKWFHYLFWPF